MVDAVNIPKSAKSPSQDFFKIREEGIKLLEKLTGRLWTDFNSHDPGITILEALCFVLTELSLKADLNMEDLIGRQFGAISDDLFTPETILPAAPLTIRDYRKYLIDHELVKNAWLEVSSKPEQAFYFDPATEELTYTVANDLILQGLYNLYLELASPIKELGDLNLPSLPRTLSILGQTVEIEVNVSSLFDTLGETSSYWQNTDIFPDWIEDLAITNVVVDAPIQSLPDGESEDYSIRIEVQYTLPDTTTGTVVFGIGISVTSILTTTIPEANMRIAIVAALTTFGDNSATDVTFWKTFNRKITTVHNAIIEIRNYFLDQRNLNEDIQNIQTVRFQEIAVNAQLLMTQGADVVQTLAKMFIKLEQFISPTILFENLDQLVEQKLSSTQIYDGPLLDNRYLQDKAILDNFRNGIIYTSDLLRIILKGQAIPASGLADEENGTFDIIAVQNLTISNFINNQLVTDQVRNCLELFNTNLYKPKLSVEKSNIQVRKGNLVINWSLEEVIEQLNILREEQELDFEASTSTLFDIKGLSLPLDEYQSLQHDFPIIYGIGKGHLPMGVPPERQALARQLKGYLILLEQLLADSAIQLSAVKDFFSFTVPKQNSFFTQEMSDIPDLPDLVTAGYINDPSLEQIRTTQNITRIAQLQEHLSGRVSEDLRATSGWMLDENRNDEWIDDQHQFLSNYPLISRERGLGYHYLGRHLRSFFEIIMDDSDPLNIFYRWEMGDAWENILLNSINTHPSPDDAEQEIRIVLAKGKAEDCYALLNAAAPTSEIQLLDNAGGTPIAQTVELFSTNATDLFFWTRERERMIFFFRDIRGTDNMSGYERRVSRLLGLKNYVKRFLFTERQQFVTTTAIAPFTFTIFDYQAKEWFSSIPFASELEAQQFASEFIQLGLLKSNYVIDDSVPANVTLSLIPSGITIEIGSFADVVTAEAYRDRLYTFLISAYGAEGFHVLEHVLLRPRDSISNNVFLSVKKDVDDQLIPGEINPYNSRISIVLPNWPARFTDITFRQLLTNTLNEEAPAHLMVDIYFLDRPQMQLFESAFFEWGFQLNEDQVTDASYRLALINLMTQVNSIRLA